MKTLVIDRSRWLRGEEPCDSALHRARDGKMCCLGLYLESCGVPIEDLTGRKYPSGVHTGLPSEALWLTSPGYTEPAAIPTRLAVTNDDRELRADARERQIQELFAAAGVDVRFVDGAGQSSGKAGGT